MIIRCDFFIPLNACKLGKTKIIERFCQVITPYAPVSPNAAVSTFFFHPKVGDPFGISKGSVAHVFGAIMAISFSLCIIIDHPVSAHRRTTPAVVWSVVNLLQVDKHFAFCPEVASQYKTIPCIFR